MVDIFVSSDAKSLRIGRNWLTDITDALLNCRAMLVFCSPYSIDRPWINFECGAGWARKIEIAPICHSGIRPVDLPLPISLLQGIEAADPSKIGQVFQMIADKLGSQMPQIDHAEIAVRVRDFENCYIEEVNIIQQLRSIKSSNGELFDTFTQLRPNEITYAGQIMERDFSKISAGMDALQNINMLSYNFSINRFTGVAPGIGGGGASGELTIKLSPRLSEIVKSMSSKP